MWRIKGNRMEKWGRRLRRKKEKWKERKEERK